MHNTHTLFIGVLNSIKLFCYGVIYCSRDEFCFYLGANKYAETTCEVGYFPRKSNLSVMAFSHSFSTPRHFILPRLLYAQVTSALYGIKSTMHNVSSVSVPTTVTYTYSYVFIHIVLRRPPVGAQLCCSVMHRCACVLL